MSFTTTKDRIWVFYDGAASWLAGRSMPVRRAGYSIFGLVLWIAYLVPGTKLRATFASLARHAGVGSPLRLFQRYVRAFLLGLNRLEQVRHGRTDAIDDMLTIPEQARLDALLEKGGVLLLVPHAHATLAMGRGLSKRYPYLGLVRSTLNARRGASEMEIYKNLGCEFLDIRKENPTTVARTVLKALKQGRLVVAISDRLRNAPPAEAPIDPSDDGVRAISFTQPIGVAGWPARFACKADVPILAATVVQTPSTISLHIGDAVTPTSDLVETTQLWVRELERLIKTAPHEWTFALDRHWSKALRESDKSG